MNRNSKLVFVTLVAFISVLALGSGFVGRAHASGVLTLNCPNAECDYTSGSTVTITGQSFATSHAIDLVVLRPDGSKDQCTGGVYSGSTTTGGLPRLATCPLSSDSSGGFVENYALDGIFGAYSVSASDGSVAVAYFHDSLSTDWTQCENDHNHDGTLDSPLCTWTTGNLDAQHDLLAEGNILPNVAPSAGAPTGTYSGIAQGHSNQRAIVQNVPDGSLRLRITYEFTKAGVKAYDFLTTDYGVTDSNLCSNLPSGIASGDCSTLVTSGPATLQFPLDSTSSVSPKSGTIADRQSAHSTAFASLVGQNRIMKVYGLGSGSITSIVNVGISGSAAGDSSYSVDIFFTKNTGSASNIIGVFGAHFAIGSLPPAGWGTGNGAGSISGSPFHVTFDGLFQGSNTLSNGGRDNQVSVSAVLGVTVSCPPSPTTSKPVTCTAVANGGLSPYTFSWSAPGGTPSTGTGSSFTTTYSTPGTYTITVTVTDSRGVTTSSSVMFTVAPQPKSLTLSCDSATAGKPVTCHAKSYGAATSYPPITYTWSAPGGTPSSGTGSGTSFNFTITFSTKGPYTVTVVQTDKDGTTVQMSTPVNVAPQPLAVTVSCPSSGVTVGKPFNCTVSASGGTGPYTGTGTFSRTEPTKGTKTETFSVTDANSASASGSASVSVGGQPLIVTVTCSSGATAGKPFNCTVSATGGTSPYSGTGTFSRTEPTKGSKSETFTVTDANGVSSSGSATVTVSPQPIVVTATCPSSGVTAGKPFNCTVSATGGTSPYQGTGSISRTEPVKGNKIETFSVTDANGASASASASVSVGAQPLVVTVDCGSGQTAGKPFSCNVSATGGTTPYSGTGTFTRTEPTKGTKAETFSVSDSNGVTASASATVTIAGQPLVVTVTCDSGVTAGKPFHCAVSATGGTAPYTGTGIFTLTEPVKGSKTETFTVIDSNGVSASGSAIVSVAPQPLIVTVNCGTGQTAGKPFNCTVSATGGTSSYTGTGIFSRTEPVKGSKTESFTVTDANGVSASGSATVTVAPQPLIVTVNCGLGQTAGKPFDCTVSATGGTSPYSGTGTFTVTQPVKGTFTETFQVRDSNNVVASGSVGVTVTPQPLIVTVNCGSGQTAGKPFNCTVSATGGTSPYSGTGTFSRTEPVKGSKTESFTVTDSNSVSASGSATVNIAPQPLVVTVNCGSGQTAGKPFNCTISATGGTQPYGGTGSFSVTEAVKGSFAESFVVTDANGVSASGSAMVFVAPQPLIVTVNCGSGQTAGKPFHCVVSAIGGTQPYAGTGIFSVTEPVKGTFTERYSVTDANQVTASGSATVTVTPQPLVITASCSNGTAGKPVYCQSSALGGTTPYYFTWDVGKDGSIDGSGQIFTTSFAVKGSYSIDAIVTDANGMTASINLPVIITPQPLVITASCSINNTAGKPVNCRASAAGGTSPYQFAWDVGKDGSIDGNGPLFTTSFGVKGTYSIDAIVTDSNGRVAFVNMPIIVAPQPLVITAQCGNGTAGKPVHCSASATGGTAPYQFSWDANKDGTIDGTGPTYTTSFAVKGTYSIDAIVLDANNAMARVNLPIIIAPQPLVAHTCPSSGTAGKPVICNGDASGGTPPYLFAWDVGKDGRIDGQGPIFTTVFPVKGTYSIDEIVTDSNNATTTINFPIVISPQPLVVTVDCGAGQTAAKPFQCHVIATGGTEPYSGTGTFTVVEPVKGTFTETFTVTDSNGVSADGSVTVSVTPQPLTVTVSCGNASGAPVTAGKPFTCDVTATGGTQPYTGTGTFTVVEPVKGTFTESFSVTDANAVSAVGSDTVTVAPQPLIVTVRCPSGLTAGKPFTCSYSASGGTAPYTSTGTSFIAPAKGQYTVPIYVTDANGHTTLGTVTVMIAPQPLVVTVTCDSSATAGKPFSCKVSATGGTQPYSGTGIFSVTEPTKGVFTESFTVTDANGVPASGSTAVTVTPQPLIVTVTCLIPGQDTAGKPFACVVSATGGTQPYTGTGTFTLTEPVKGTFVEQFSVTDANGVTASGSAIVVVAPQPLIVTVDCGTGQTAGKPFSCTVSATGGTKPYTGTGTFTVTEPVKGSLTESFTVRDSNGASASGSTTVSVAPQPLIVTVDCGSGQTAGKPFSCTVSATGGTQPYTGTGTFTVAEPVKGIFTESFTASDANGATAIASVTVDVHPQPLIVTVSCSSAPTAGKPFNCTVSATGGTGPYTGTGTFTVTQPVKGTFHETFIVADANQVTALASTTVSVSPQPLVITASCNAGTAGKPTNCNASAIGGTSPYQFAWDVGKDGSIDGQGPLFTEAFAVKGTYSIDAIVTDANGASATVNLPIAVAPQPLVITASCNAGTAGKPTSCNASAVGGTGPYRFTWDVGKDGSIDGNGPTFTTAFPVKGSYSIDAVVIDANGASAAVNLPIIVQPQPLVITASCNAGTAGKPTNCNASAIGGTAPYTFTWDAGKDGSIDGNGPTFTTVFAVKGSYSVDAIIRDANGAIAQVNIPLSVNPQPLVVTVVCPSSGITAGKPFTCTVSATGGTSPYTGTGSFSVTQPVKGSFTESFTVSDSNGVRASGSGSVTVIAQPLVVTVTCPSAGVTAGKPFNCTVSATGGTGPYTGTGSFSITKAVKGAYSVSFTVTDSNGATASGSASVTVVAQPLVVTVTCPTSGVTAGKPFNCTVSATGGTSPYTGTGTFSVTKAVKGSYTISYTVTDSNGATATGSATVTVGAQPLIANFSSVCSGSSTVFTATVSGGTSPYAYSWNFGDSQTGTGNPVSHVYGSSGTFTVTLTVTDANSATTTVTKTASGCGQPVVVTDTSFCRLPNNNFVLIFITDPQNPSGYRLVSSNPGQFYDNVFYSAAPGSPVTLNIQVPYPFITNGAYPIQVSTGFSLTSQGCFLPNFANPSGFTITAPGPLSPSGHPTIVLSNYSPQNFGSTVTVTVTGTVPSTGLVYVTIHLDYGLKGTTGWLKGVAQGSSFQATNSGLGLTLNNGQSYSWSVSGSESYTTSVTSSNVFKKDPGIAGVITDISGNPIAGATVKVYDNNGMLLGITTTDQNGVYLYFYKYSGTKVNFSIKAILPSGAVQTAMVQMQSNKLVLQTFTF